MASGIASLVRKLPVYAVDIKTNLEKIFLKEVNDFLSQDELYSVALTVGYALGHEHVLNNIRADAKLFLEESNATACKVAAVMMSMNNTFYNFKEMSGDDEIKNAESGLMMNTINNVSIEMKIFEMCCLAVSILNKCEYCIKVHQKKLSKRGVTKEAFMEIARVVSVLSAAVSVVEIERLRSYDFIAREANIDD